MNDETIERERKMEGGENSSNYAYRECLRNHAASLGSYSTDGCGEFTVDDTSPGCLQCAACGCHRNFHRKLTYPPTHHPRGRDRGDGHHEMMSAELIDYGGDGGSEGRQLMESAAELISKRRFRTKFTADQKEKMLAFAEKLGWKLQRKDLEDEIERFCRGVGVSRQVFKVWMHNHKNSSSSSASTGNASSLTQ
ncbi:Zinc-finger homeodomain protein [Quillaja saponaria]|uniref:Zinc-finger homeodomain protein n=1 Tax=Quillaja saponaria TaxID=32244 RepID=A0AAD7M5D0_QUISA|nr:Zinc-finger homeodomain protein [Quillaja saponaria]